MPPMPLSDRVITLPVPREFIAHYTTPDALNRWSEHRMHLHIGDYDLGEWELESIQAFVGVEMAHYAVLRRVYNSPEDVPMLWG